MYFCLVIALISTFIWLNSLHADSINAKLNPYGDDGDKEKQEKRARFKTYLVIIMAVFWAAVIRFY